MSGDLLSRKSLLEFTPEEFKAHVISLKRAPEGKERTIKIKQPPPPFIAKLDKRGRFLFKLNRIPRWMSREEIEKIAKDLNLPFNEVWIKIITKAKVPIDVSTQEEQEKIQKELADIPW